MRVRNVKNADELILKYPSIVVQNPSEYKGNWKKYFNNNNPIYVEIGMGKGQFIIKNALLNKDINYIGIEKEKSIVYKALNKVLDTNDKGIDNLVILNIDAANILDIFEDNEVDKIYLNFSDPWPKTRHEKRRLTGPIIFNNILKVLNGDLEFKSDNRKLFEYSIMQFNNLGLNILELSLDLHKDNPDVISTEYEDKFVAMNMPIYYVKIKKGE